MLDLKQCRVRQDRLRAVLEEKAVGGCVLSSQASVYYFSGLLPDARLPHVLVLTQNSSVLVTNSTKASAAERTVRYESYSLDRVITLTTMMQEVVRSIAEAPELGGERHVGIETEWIGVPVRDALSSKKTCDITADVQRLRRRKDSDEVAQIRRVVAITEAGYSRAKETVRHGNTELDVFKATAAAMVDDAGTSLMVQGDFACGNRNREGGPPTKRAIGEGDLFILDFFPGYEGYRADLCRTFAASTPTDLQYRAWLHVRSALALAEEMLKPGLKGAELYKSLRSFLDDFEPARGSFYHHAGHGVGLDAQEFPWLTPGSEHVLEAGDVVAVEPGVYGEILQGGIRLEQNYLITETGCERLSNFPLDMS